jgi:23S rRNA (uracil1939-C5)-methyltransferase
VVEVIEPGPSRVQAPCPYFPRCGGCQIQHIAYDEQLRQKQMMVRDAMERIGKLGVEVLPTMGMGDPWRYRNTAEYAVARATDGPAVGFMAGHSHEVVPIEDCLVQHPLGVEVMRAFRGAARETGWLADWEGPDPAAHLVTRVSSAQEAALATIVYPAHASQPQAVAERMLEAVPKLVGVTATATKRRTWPAPAQSRPLAGEWALEERLGGLSFRVSADSFFQVNAAQAERLVELVTKWAQVRRGEAVVDAYSGVGIFMVALGAQGARVMGIESHASAMRDARANARRAGLEARLVHGNVERVLPMLARREMAADVVVLDPPRGGCGKAALVGAAALGPRAMVMVSCDAATLARDLRVLADLGYRVDRLQPVDLFPHSHHVEVVARAVRSGE